MPGDKALIDRRHYRLSADSSICTRERVSARMKASLIMFEISWETCSSQLYLATILQPIAVTVKQKDTEGIKGRPEVSGASIFTRMSIKYDTNLSRQSFYFTQSVGILLASRCSSAVVAYNLPFCLLIVLLLPTQRLNSENSA